jgi:hypothetical protein
MYVCMYVYQLFGGEVLLVRLSEVEGAMVEALVVVLFHHLLPVLVHLLS